MGALFLKELETEVEASRKCLERIPAELYDYKPHEKSMQMGYLALMVAEIPKWITLMIQKGEIDFVTMEHSKARAGTELAAHFDENMKEVRPLLQNVSDEALTKTFSLKNKGQLLFSAPVGDTISGSIRHLVHHRGQLTVYLRLNDIPVPSIYGPSADDKTF